MTEYQRKLSAQKFFTPGAGILVRELDGTWRRGDDKPLTEYDRALIAGERPWDYWDRKDREAAAARKSKEGSG